jgi:voltage-gated potassium channel
MFRQVRFILVLLLITGIAAPWLFWTYEQGINPSVKTYDDALWWWFVSSTTVGYGDVAPITPMGRAAGVLTILVGIYCYTNFIALTADSLHGLTNRHHLGTAQVEATDHIVICEYTAFADELLQVLDRHPALAGRKVALVTDLVQVRPYPQYSFVRGVPISPAALKQSNIAAAAFIFVFANIRFQDADLKTIHTVSRIRKLNSHARIFIELGNPNSDLLAHLTGEITVLASRDLLESVLRDKGLDLRAHFPASPVATGARST